MSIVWCGECSVRYIKVKCLQCDVIHLVLSAETGTCLLEILGVVSKPLSLPNFRVEDSTTFVDSLSPTMRQPIKDALLLAAES